MPHQLLKHRINNKDYEAITHFMIIGLIIFFTSGFSLGKSGIL